MGDTFDAAGFFWFACAIGARLAFAAIDGELVLEIAELAIGLNIIAQG